MGKPAATVGSSTAHGTPLAGPGCPTVLINKKPAWRVTDVAPCSMTTPVGTPHGVETTIGPGSPTVLIGKLPASVVGDTLQGAGVPNSIVMGAPTVLIG